MLAHSINTFAANLHPGDVVDVEDTALVTVYGKAELAGGEQSPLDKTLSSLSSVRSKNRSCGESPSRQRSSLPPANEPATPTLDVLHLATRPETKSYVDHAKVVKSQPAEQAPQPLRPTLTIVRQRFSFVEAALPPFDSILTTVRRRMLTAYVDGALGSSRGGRVTGRLALSSCFRSLLRLGPSALRSSLQKRLELELDFLALNFRLTHSRLAPSYRNISSPALLPRLLISQHPAFPLELRRDARTPLEAYQAWRATVRTRQSNLGAAPASTPLGPFRSDAPASLCCPWLTLYDASHPWCRHQF